MYQNCTGGILRETVVGVGLRFELNQSFEKTQNIQIFQYKLINYKYIG